jgi:hypothetical protein
MRKFIAVLFLGLITQYTFAKTVKLDPAQSGIKYKIEAVGIKDGVNGVLDASKSSLEGSLSGSDETGATDLTGTVTLKNPYFNSGDAGRDEHVHDMMAGDIVIQVKAPTGKVSEDTFTVPVIVTWNQQTNPEVANVKLNKVGDVYTFRAALTLDRKKYDVHPKSGHRLADPLISNDVKIATLLTFKQI